MLLGSKKVFKKTNFLQQTGPLYLICSRSYDFVRKVSWADVVTLRPILTFNTICLALRAAWGQTKSGNNTISLLYLARQRERLARFAPNKGLTTSPDNLTGDARPRFFESMSFARGAGATARRARSDRDDGR